MKTKRYEAMTIKQDGQKLVRIEQSLSDVKEQMIKGFEGVHKRLDISNGRIGKLEVNHAESQTRIKNIYKELADGKKEYHDKFVAQKDYEKDKAGTKSNFEINSFKTNALWGGAMVLGMLVLQIVAKELGLL